MKNISLSEPPQLIDFYESNLRWKTVDEDAMDEDD